MKHYTFAQTFREVYERALAAYKAGATEAAALLSAEDSAFVASYGGRNQDFFDYAEDAVKHGEPDFATALLIESVRRDYFLTVQKGVRSPFVIVTDKMPAKTDAVRGIEWLPRIIPKAKAKLRGELPQELMYCCGGDRNFFKTHDIHPAEFLRLVWAHADHHENRIIDWVEARSKAARG